MRFVERTSRPGVLSRWSAERIAGSPPSSVSSPRNSSASCLALGSGLLGESLRPIALDFAYPSPAHVARYREVFDCPLDFGQPHNRLLLVADLLATPLRYNPTASWQVLALVPAGALSGNPARSPRRWPACSTTWRKTRAGRDRRPPACPATHPAPPAQPGRRQLPRHPRPPAHRACAGPAARDQKTSIAAVGAQVGFRDPREFRRAFKRWTGAPPSAARARR